MKLPRVGEIVVPREKVENYLLAPEHPVGGPKARFFLRRGFSRDRCAELGDALMRHARDHDVREVQETAFGTKFIVEGNLPSPDGTSPPIRAVWMIESGTNVPRFITAYPFIKEVSS